MSAVLFCYPAEMDVPPQRQLQDLEERLRVLEAELEEARDKARRLTDELAELHKEATRLENTYAGALDRRLAGRGALSVLEAVLVRLSLAVRHKYRLRHHTYHRF